MGTTSEAGADKISREIFDQLCFMSEAYSTTTADGYKEFIVFLFSNLQEIVNDESLPEALTGRYSALVYLMMHHFLDIRHQIASGVAVSQHVLPALDALAGVDTAKDVKLIFRLLEVSMRTADTISFADVSADEMEPTLEGYDDDRSGDTAISTVNGINPDRGESPTTLQSPGMVQIWRESSPGVDTIYDTDIDTDIDIDNSDHHDTNSKFTDRCIRGAEHGHDNGEVIRMGEGQDEGDSLHGSDVMLVDLGELHTMSIFDESDCDVDSSGSGHCISPLSHGRKMLNVSTDIISRPIDSLNPPINDSLGEVVVVSSNALDDSSPKVVSIQETGNGPAGCKEIEKGIKSLSFETKSDNSVSSIVAFDSLSPVSCAISPSSEPAPSVGVILEAPETPKNKAFNDWVKMRRGITLVRIDSERARLVRTAEALQLAAEATDKFWVKLVRKVESEGFNDAHDCQWKLGVSHESFFPGRKRVVLRPRFDVSIDDEYLCDEEEMREREREVDEERRRTLKVKEDQEGEDGGLKLSDIQFKDLGEVKAALAKALGGLITDITQAALSDLASVVTPHCEEDNKTNPHAGAQKKDEVNSPESGTLVPPGCGWGLVDADGSDEGYGVIGLEMGLDNDHHRSHHGTECGNGSITRDSKNDISMDGLDKNAVASLPSNTNTAVVKPAINSTSGGTGAVMNDRMGDVRLVEATMREGRDAVETGPCHSGTKKAGSGPTILISRVIMVTASGNFWGTLSFNGREVFFTSSFEPEDGHKDDSAAVNLVQQLRMRRRRWTLSSVCAVYLRRYRLRDSAMEIFFRRGKHRNFFVDFGHTREDERHRQAFARALMDVAPSGCFKQWPSMSPYRLVPELGVQEKWVSGRMSNFDYLMALNTISGRSFNDLCQYPVMPWIISQYENDTIDLNDPASFRDLSKPVGALNESRLKDFLERFHSFGEQTTSVGSSSGNSGGELTVTPTQYQLYFVLMLQSSSIIYIFIKIYLNQNKLN